MLSFLKMSWASQFADVAPLVLRVMAGVIFLLHGWMKVGTGVAGIAGFLGSLGFPLATAFAVILIATEVLGGIALILGFGTRLAALLTGIVALVATVLVHLSKGFMVGGGGYEFSLLLTLVCVSLLITGAGKYSVDSKLGV